MSTALLRARQCKFNLSLHLAQVEKAAEYSAFLATLPPLATVQPRHWGGPLLPPKKAEHAHKKTLVLDLDETMVHAQERAVPDKCEARTRATSTLHAHPSLTACLDKVICVRACGPHCCWTDACGDLHHEVKYSAAPAACVWARVKRVPCSGDQDPLQVFGTK